MLFLTEPERDRIYDLSERAEIVGGYIAAVGMVISLDRKGYSAEAYDAMKEVSRYKVEAMRFNKRANRMCGGIDYRKLASGRWWSWKTRGWVAVNVCRRIRSHGILWDRYLPGDD